MRLQQLKLYETLLGGSAERARQLLSHQPFLRPLLDLLNQFAAAKTDSRFLYGSKPGPLINCMGLYYKTNESVYNINIRKHRFLF